MATIGDGDHCGKPDCDREAEESYEGPNGNSIRLCGMHYYNLVTSGRSESSRLGFGTDRITQPYLEREVRREGVDFEPELDLKTEPELGRAKPNEGASDYRIE